MLIQRRWKRDGTVNRMGMLAACENLKLFAVREDIRKQSILTIRMRLARGEKLETKRAVFSVAWRVNGNALCWDSEEGVLCG